MGAEVPKQVGEACGGVAKPSQMSKLAKEEAIPG